MGPWTVHVGTVHSWQSQLLRAGIKKKRKKKEENVEKNADADFIAIQMVT